MENYRYRSTENLVKLYAEEASRINQDDAKATKTLIKKELKRRFRAFMELLDDDQTKANPIATFNYLLGK